MEESRTIIVSNRLPVKIQLRKQEWKLQSSEGGLATGLGSIFPDGNNIWIGWPGVVVGNPETQKAITTSLSQKNLKAIWLSQAEIQGFYEGFSNETLWPLFHYFPSFARFNAAHWEAYKKVNQKFAEAVLQHAKPQDTLWIHDYQLLLLPELIRQKLPDISIGFFQHIPFPSYEIFRLVPWREELLKGLLGADLIGFHTFDDTRHFLNAVSRILNLPGPAHEIIYEGRKVMADAFPMGIDYEKYRKSALNDKTKKNERKLKRMTGDKKLMISIDRLDYTKGILQRLQAYELFLKKYPQLREELAFLQLIVPSRDNVRQYAALKEEINRMVSDINARYGNLNWQPIYYFYRSFPMDMISAMYASADIALVAPLRDGMNLVSKEYVASKTDRNGVLILSELAGASKELYDALIINPHNSNALADAIYEALTMPGREQKRRMENMQQVVQKFNIQLWIKNFMNRLKSIKQKQADFSTKNLQEPSVQMIINHYRQSRLRLIFLDYDGTLVPFEDNPLRASPDKELIQLLQKIIADPRNKLVLISGRKKDTLEQWFGGMKLDIIAEHGAWIKKDDQEWQCNSKLNNDWKDSILPLLKQYEMRTPGSFIEEKSFSLAWHYRKADRGLGELRAQEIIHNLNHILSGSGLQLLQGSKVIEIKSMHIHKGRAAEIWTRQYEADFILAMGDDVTDEDTFKAMPGGSFTIKIGTEPTTAAYYVKDLNAGRAFLMALALSETDDHLLIEPFPVL